MRTYVVTGSASGIGAATSARFRGAGHRVIGIDLGDADVEVDLSTDAGRNAMVDQVGELADGAVDGIVACAGIAQESPLTISVNYFGAVATLRLLRPFLGRSEAPRAVVVASVASLLGADAGVVEACLADDEVEACRLMEDNPSMAYLTSKTALARWVRRVAPTPAWAGAGIPLNAVAPGTVLTPMTTELLASDAGRDLVDSAVPMPLNGHARPETVAAVLGFLAHEENTHITGQVVFVDGGADAVLRGDATW
ncbi:MAG: SDR family oxidoreductase [Acidimicrobiales bacterium]